jgi:hypothetical protein
LSRTSRGRRGCVRKLTGAVGRATTSLDGGMPVRVVVVEPSRPTETMYVEVAVRLAPSAGAERKCEDATAIPVTGRAGMLLVELTSLMAVSRGLKLRFETVSWCGGIGFPQIVDMLVGADPVNT